MSYFFMFLAGVCVGVIFGIVWSEENRMLWDPQEWKKRISPNIITRMRRRGKSWSWHDTEPKPPPPPDKPKDPPWPTKNP
jgi:hypothetical protein